MKYTPAKLRRKNAGKSWVMPYNRLTAIYDPKAKQILYLEEYGPKDGIFVEGWRALHYPRTSKLVEKTVREAGTTIVTMREGRSSVKLVPSISPLGIESCTVKNKEITLGFVGIGGAGVSASFSRGMAQGVKRVEVLAEGGGRKNGRSLVVLPKMSLLLIGVDDTDNETEGATYALVHNLAIEVEKKYKVRYLTHVNVQLYPYNPNKTKNCFATVVGFVCGDEIQKRNVVNQFKKRLLEETFSQNTAMAVYDGFVFGNDFIEKCREVKFKMISDPHDLYKSAIGQGVKIMEITGSRGSIGAVAALPFWDQPDYAAKLPTLLSE